MKINEELKRVDLMLKVSAMFFETRKLLLSYIIEECNSNSSPELRALKSELRRLSMQEEKFYQLMKILPDPLPDVDVKFFYDVFTAAEDF